MISRKIIANAKVIPSVVLVDTYKCTDGTPHRTDAIKPVEAGFGMR